MMRKGRLYVQYTQVFGRLDTNVYDVNELMLCVRAHRVSSS
jgi:hypothetical protein